MIKQWVAPLALGLSLTLAAPVEAKKKEISGLELQQIQSHDFEGTKDVVFASVMSVLQDAGYRIQAADKDTGLITASASTKSSVDWTSFVGLGFSKSKKTPIASVFIESINSTITRVRINFVMGKIKSTLYGSQAQDEEPILDAATYQQAFEKIEQAVFLRQSMAAPTPAAARLSAPASPPAMAVTPMPAQSQTVAANAPTSAAASADDAAAAKKAKDKAYEAEERCRVRRIGC